jgi:hypothetical protein
MGVRMRRPASLAFASSLAFCVLVGGAARADDPPASPLSPKEIAARQKAADELAAFAKSCAMYSAWDDARQAYAKAIALSPPGAGDPLKAEAEKLKDKTGAPAAGAAAGVADRKTKCLAKCADLLAPAAAAYAQADQAADLARVIGLMKGQGLPLEAPLTKAGVVQFAPYLTWHKKQDAEKLEKGWEVIDGAWTDPAKLVELNAAHAAWTAPWIVADDVHEVRTTMPLRTARQVLARVAAFRRFFLDYFAGEWDLQTPSVKLPIILTQTQAELGARVKEVFPELPASSGGSPASYLTATSAGNPCFISFEVTGPGGASLKLDLAAVQLSIQHEVALQLAYEYSKHAADKTRLSKTQIWAIQGLPEYMSYYALVDGNWVLTKPKEVEVAGAAFDGAFAWCKSNVGRIPPLGQYTALPRERFRTPENFHIAATLAWFLLEGNERKYRPHFVKVLETIYRCRDEQDTFVKCFEGVHDLDAEFRKFCKAIQVDKK